MFSLFIICKVIYSDPTGKVEGTEETLLIWTQKGTCQSIHYLGAHLKQVNFRENICGFLNSVGTNELSILLYTGVHRARFHCILYLTTKFYCFHKQCLLL